MDQEDQAYIEGVAAHQAGKPYTDNPYRPSIRRPFKSDQWATGWRHSEEALKGVGRG